MHHLGSEEQAKLINLSIILSIRKLDEDPTMQERLDLSIVSCGHLVSFHPLQAKAIRPVQANGSVIMPTFVKPTKSVFDVAVAHRCLNTAGINFSHPA
jgi:hypothetical protein